jgi:hypothetical protein
MNRVPSATWSSHRCAAYLCHCAAQLQRCPSEVPADTREGLRGCRSCRRARLHQRCLRCRSGLASDSPAAPSSLDFLSVTSSVQRSQVGKGTRPHLRVGRPESVHAPQPLPRQMPFTRPSPRPFCVRGCSADASRPTSTVAGRDTLRDGGGPARRQQALVLAGVWASSVWERCVLRHRGLVDMMRTQKTS